MPPDAAKAPGNASESSAKGEGNGTKQGKAKRGRQSRKPPAPGGETRGRGEKRGQGVESLSPAPCFQRSLVAYLASRRHPLTDLAIRIGTRKLFKKENNALACRADLKKAGKHKE